jgi:transcriptional regulator with XRE-family HTH domain
MRYPETASIILAARKRKGVSQERAAQKVGCSRLQWIRWEQGLHRPEPDGFGAKLAEYLGIGSDALSAADSDDDEEAASMQPFGRDIMQALNAAIDRAVSARMAALASAERKDEVQR